MVVSLQNVQCTSPLSAPKLPRPAAEPGPQTGDEPNHDPCRRSTGPPGSGLSPAHWSAGSGPSQLTFPASPQGAKRTAAPAAWRSVPASGCSVSRPSVNVNNRRPQGFPASVSRQGQTSFSSSHLPQTSAGRTVRAHLHSTSLNSACLLSPPANLTSAGLDVGSVQYNTTTSRRNFDLLNSPPASLSSRLPHFGRLSVA
jgi:hypothetical protein